MNWRTADWGSFFANLAPRIFNHSSVNEKTATINKQADSVACPHSWELLSKVVDEV
jgi:hypothetical protein